MVRLVRACCDSFASRWQNILCKNELFSLNFGQGDLGCRGIDLAQVFEVWSRSREKELGLFLFSFMLCRFNVKVWSVSSSFRAESHWKLRQDSNGAKGDGNVFASDFEAEKKKNTQAKKVKENTRWLF